MTTQTGTTVELSALDQDASRLMLTVPAIPFEGPANTPLGHTIGSESIEGATETLPKARSWIVVTQLSGINLVNSFSNGLLTVALPAISEDLKLHRSLLLWPSSAYALTSGTCLLLAGAIADVIGTRAINLTGCFFIAVFILGSGFSQTGIQLVLFRAMQGIGGAFSVTVRHVHHFEVCRERQAKKHWIRKSWSSTAPWILVWTSSRRFIR